jgi:Helix-turn-helix of DDE superfamily endonuclease
MIHRSAFARRRPSPWIVWFDEESHTTGRAPPVYRLPGLSLKAAAVIVDLAEQNFPDWNRGIGRPKALTLIEALRLSLCRLRRNATYNDLHEDFAVAESTAWDYHQRLVAFLADVLGTTDEELPALLTGRIFLITPQARRQRPTVRRCPRPHHRGQRRVPRQLARHPLPARGRMGRFAQSQGSCPR